ncbi:MAG: Xaa-Pro aminopeptidase [Myxococcota bacterium]|jgi:Xaa-Pro aminopeptidase
MGYGATMFDADLGLYARNRARFLDALGDDAALFFGAPHHIRNGDSEFRYRPDSDVLYLSGWTQPEVALLFRPGHEQPFLMFVQPRDPKVEQWAGRRPGIEGAIEQYGADAAFPFRQLAEKLPSLLQGYRTLHYRFAADADHDRLVAGAVRASRKQARYSGLDVPDAFIDPSRTLHELRLKKTAAEIAILRQAALITTDAHRAAMAATAPGVFEYELEAIIEGTFRRRGGNGPGYSSIVGGGPNATILHYVDNNMVLRDGELVCVDAGCEVRYYTADVTRTWPVSGTFTGLQRDLYEVVLLAQRAAIDTVRAGGAFLGPHNAATRALTEGMVALGLLEGDVDELIATEAHKRYYMHGTSHWLGLDVHDVGAYARSGASRPLEPGMVLTIEPGLYIAEDDTDAPEALRGVGIRIEDDILVTDGDPDILTDAAPRSIRDVEAAVRGHR